MCRLFWNKSENVGKIRRLCLSLGEKKMKETNTVVEIETVIWKHGTVIDGERKGSQVLVAPMNPEGVHQVIYATGAVGWYIPEDLKIQEEEGL